MSEVKQCSCCGNCQTADSQLPWTMVKEQTPEGIWHMEGRSPQRILVSCKPLSTFGRPYSMEALWFDDEEKFYTRNLDGKRVDITSDVVAWMHMPKGVDVDG